MGNVDCQLCAAGALTRMFVLLPHNNSLQGRLC